MSELDEYLNFAKELAKEAGEIMNRYFDADNLAIESKPDASFVTVADNEINDLVIRRVKDKFPKSGVLGEEESYNLDADMLWVVDPIDGTTVFSRKIPLSVFSIALLESGQPKVAVIHSPFMQRIWWAVKSQGAYLNGKKLDLSNYKPQKHKLVAADVMAGEPWASYKTAKIGKLDLEKLREAGAHVYMFPTALGPPLVASGSLDGSITSTQTPWDLSAAGLIAMEAGAKVTDLAGMSVERWDKEINGLCVAPEKFHKTLLDVPMPAV